MKGMSKTPRKSRTGKEVGISKPGNRSVTGGGGPSGMQVAGGLENSTYRPNGKAVKGPSHTPVDTGDMN